MSGWFWIVAAIGLGVVVGGLADYLLLARPGYQPVPLVMDPVPTLFIPGHLGTRYSFGHMLWRLQRRYGLSKDVVAIVAPDGKVHLRGQLNLNHHAAVQVLFTDKAVRPAAQLHGLEKVIAALQTQQAFAEVNIVGHSMGGVTAVLYLLSKPTVPVANLVTIAAPMNDLEVAQRSPILNWRLTRTGPEHAAPIYQQFQKTIGNLPANLRWLNIAGDLLIGGRHDGEVAINSSFAIRYLVKDRIKDYTEVVIRGPRAAHSLLHENRLVDHDIVEYLWQRQRDF